MSIERFRGEHYFLSSMYPIEEPGGIRVADTIKVATVEPLYKAARFAQLTDRQQVLGAPNGFAAKSIADKLEKSGAPVRDNWEALRLPVMRSCVALKFGQNPGLAEQLVATGDEELVEGMRGERFSFWGVAPIGSRNGSNWLGRILMDTRALLVNYGASGGPNAEQLLNDMAVLAPENIEDTPERYLGSVLLG